MRFCGIQKYTRRLRSFEQKGKKGTQKKLQQHWGRLKKE